MAEIFYNQSVPQKLRDHIENELSNYTSIDGTTQISMKSEFVPELIMILESASDWFNIYHAAGLYFINQLHKTISKANETLTENIINKLWNKKEKIYQILNDENAKPIKDLAKTILSAKENTSDQAQIIIGFPFPDKFNASSFEITSDNEFELAFYLSKFLTEVEGLEKTIRKECGNEAFGIEVELLENGNFSISWQDREGNQQQIKYKT